MSAPTLPTPSFPQADPAAAGYPRENARTLRYSLGRPRSFTISADGQRVLFVRSESGTSRTGDLWSFDIETGEETCLVNAAQLIGGDEKLSPLERARRERMREGAAGIVAYSTDKATSCAVFTLSGELYHLDLATGQARQLSAQAPVIDPRVDPTGSRVAYASQGQLRVLDLASGADSAVAEPEHDLQVWGVADFIAGEELDRSRGYWWSPDGTTVLAERYDDTSVAVRWVSDPANPEAAPVQHRYPAAGTTNSDVTLWLVDASGATPPRAVDWDRQRFEYVSSVHWSDGHPPLVQVLNRQQDAALVLAVSSDGATSVVRELSDECWVDVVTGTPAWTPDGQLVTVEVADDRYALCLDGKAVSSPELQVRQVLDVSEGGITVIAASDPTEAHVWRYHDGAMTPVTTVAGVHAGVTTHTDRGLVDVVVTSTLDTPSATISVTSGGRSRDIPTRATTAQLQPRVQWLHDHDLDVAVVLPLHHQPGQRLPILLDPYGGPHFCAAMKSQAMFRESQWFAEQGFAVVVCDGHGTPRNPSWERSVRFDLADVVLADQVAAVQIATAAMPDLDASRVAIRGWSFGGYLSAMAVLRRPDVFHAAVAGAPVTDQRLYDTAYSERYLGLPDEHPEAYERTNLMNDAASLSRPLMLIHGFADDNVLVANTLQLSARLMEAGRPHTVLPLSGVTHMTPQEVVAENLLLLQVSFLKEALALT